MAHDLSEMGEILKTKSPYGFVISSALSETLEKRWRLESGTFSSAPAPDQWNGIKVVVDPELPDTEFDVVFTAEMWSRRLADLKK